MCEVLEVRNVSGDLGKLSCFWYKAFGQHWKPVMGYHLGYDKWLVTWLDRSKLRLAILEV